MFGDRKSGWMHSKIDTGVQRVISRAHEAHDRRFAGGSCVGFGGAWRHRAGAKTALVGSTTTASNIRSASGASAFQERRLLAMFVCPRCGGGSQRLRLLDDRPACGKCVRASGLIYRSQSIRTEKRHRSQRRLASPCLTATSRARPSSTGPEARRAGEHGVRASSFAHRRSQAWRRSRQGSGL